jgi:anti-sigma28 factor (negative regulator of flagellin synthesis)
MKAHKGFRIDADLLVLIEKFVQREHCSFSYAVNKHLRIGLNSEPVTETTKDIPKQVYTNTEVKHEEKFVDTHAIRVVENRIEELKEEINEQELLITTHKYSSQIAVDARILKRDLLSELTEQQNKRLILMKG